MISSEWEMDSQAGFDTNSISQFSLVYFEKPGSDIQKTGYLKKLKTGRKKFFVLRSTSSSGPARLEYYDSEKKYKASQLPKRIIHLHKCFNINKKSDTKHKFAIGLYLIDDSFSVIAENQEDFTEWLNLLLEYQNEYLSLYSDIEPKIHYEFIWQVTIRPKGLSITKNMCGQYRLCLSDTAVCFYRVNSDKADYIFQLASIRRCGHRDSFFYMEVGRSAPTGDGELWIQVEDKDIAQNLHEEVLKHMRASGSNEEIVQFRQRSSTGTSAIMASRHKSDDPMRQRTNSDSLPHGSPRRIRSTQLDTKRPQSTVVTSRPPTLTAVTEPHASLMGTSPQSSPGYVNELAVPQHGHRFRSDSAESRGSRSSVMSADIFGSSPAEMFIHPVNHSVTPESLPKPITEESSNYLDMSPGQRSSTPSPPRERPERPGSAHSGSGSDSHDSSTKADGYMDMQPGSSVGSDRNNSGYLDMAPCGTHHDKGFPNESTGYLMMGPGAPHAASTPIPIRPVKEPGYMDMAPSSQPLPTVKEGGSGEAYLPMTPGGTSPVSAAELKPAKVISYLSDDSTSGDFPKRAYSVGSRPVSKTISHRHHHNPEATSKQGVSDNGRSSSAPHLIVQKIKRENQMIKNNPYMPMDGSNTYSHVNNYLNSDSDSFMEMDFYRPRTASESFGSRPRSSSFNKVFAQGHRPRSSSYGHSSRGGKMGSFESVRTTSKELLHRLSHESVGRFSSPSSRTSSLESLRKTDNQSRCSNQSDYVEMHLDKKDNNSGYIDMTLPGGNNKSRTGTSRSSSNQSLSSSPAMTGFISPVAMEKLSPDVKIIKASGHVVQKPTGFHPPGAQDVQNQSLFTPTTYASSSGSRSPSVTGRSSAGSGRESEDDSYVPFEPATQTRDGKISKSKTSSPGSHKKHDKSKHRSSKHIQGTGSPTVSKDLEKSSLSSECSSKDKSADVESSYLEYEPGDIHVKDERSSGKNESHGKKLGQEELHNKKTSTNTSVESKSGSVHVIKDKPVAESANTSDSGYMDYEPPTPEKPVETQTSKESKDVKETKESLRRNNSSNKSLSSLRRNNSSNKSFDGDKQQDSYTKMEYDPSSHHVDEDDTSEVKSPTRVRSYIAATSLETECVSEQQSSKVPQHKDDSDKKVEKDNSKSAIVMAKQESDADKSKDQASTNVKQTIVKSKSPRGDGSKSKKKKENKRKEDKSRKGQVEKDDTLKVSTNVPPIDNDDDDGYVGLDYTKDISERTQETQGADSKSSKTLNQNKYVNLQSADNAPFKLKALPTPEPVTVEKKSAAKVEPRDFPKGNKSLSKVEVKDVPKGNKVASPGVKLNSENRNGRKISTSKIKGSQPLPPLPVRKSSVSSLDEMYLEESVVRKEKDSSEQERAHKPPKLIMPVHELQKQNSMPCMNLPVEVLAQKVPNTSPASIELVSSPRSRHSCSDLMSAYEQMTYPSQESSPGHQASSQQLTPPGGPQPQLTPPSAGSSGGQPQLNYASLDLGSSENVNNGDPKSPRIKSRHSSSADETTGPPLSYAQIDFKLSESLKNSNTKECRFSFE